MSLSRRQTLALIGGGTIIAASGAAGYAVTRTPRTALLPWEQAGQYAEPRMKALSYAILAPNPHNRQPWLVDLRGEDEVTLYVDTERLLPHTDPFSRQIVVGLGCFLELMVLAAAQDGYDVSLDLFPDGEDASALDQRRVAVARFAKSGAVAEPALFDQVLSRHTLRAAYDMDQRVAPDTLAMLESAVQRGSGVGTTQSDDMLAVLRDLTEHALEVEFMTPRTYKESVDLFRIGHKEVDANPDGLTFTGPFFETMRLTGMFSREGALPQDSFGFKSGLDMVRAAARSGMGYVWLTTPGNSRAEQIAAGRDWVRVHLAATAVGLGVQPMSQALQEFDEMQGLYQKMHQLLAPTGEVVQMLGRLGYASPVAQSPRWPVTSKVLNA